VGQVGPIAARECWAVAGEGPRGRARRGGGPVRTSRRGGGAAGQRPAWPEWAARRGRGQRDSEEGAGSGGARRALWSLCEAGLRPPAPGSLSPPLPFPGLGVVCEVPACDGPETCSWFLSVIN